MTASYGIVLSLLLAIIACSDSRTANLYGLEYHPEDFVIAQPTCVHRLPLTKASREWRGKGIRAFTVLNNTKLVDELNRDPESHENQEAYGYWEDDSVARGSWRGGNVGDTRAAVTPFLAHRHFGESYKWMLYGDDDTLFYMTGVLKLLSQFDPEVPLAITDNVWFNTLHPSPYAPRCLPCGFNTSTIVTNHTFTPRPACPFCTRALACGTYGPRYHCNTTHLAALAERFGPDLLAYPHRPSAAADPGSVGSQRNQQQQQGQQQQQQQDSFRAAMRQTVAEYAAWMGRHVETKARYPWVFRNKPAMDFEMREGPGEAGESGGDGGEDGAFNARNRRRLLGEGEGGGNDNGSDAGRRKGGTIGGDAYVHRHRRQQQRRRHRRRRVLTGATTTSATTGTTGRSNRLRNEMIQPFVDGTPWLSEALGRPVGQGDPELEKLKLPYPFCARHDERMHTRAAPSCLISISGHGGTGIIFSVGLMRLIDPEVAIRFITKQRGCGGGDCLLGRLLWFRMGIGFTDPGTALQHGASLYEHHARFIDSNNQMPQLYLLADPAGALLRRPRQASGKAPSCEKDGSGGEACVWLIENVVGTHVRAQYREANATAEEMLKRFRSHARAYEWVTEARRDPAVVAGSTSVVRAVQARHKRGEIQGHKP